MCSTCIKYITQIEWQMHTTLASQGSTHARAVALNILMCTHMDAHRPPPKHVNSSTGLQSSNKFICWQINQDLDRRPHHQPCRLAHRWVMEEEPQQTEHMPGWLCWHQAGWCAYSVEQAKSCRMQKSCCFPARAKKVLAISQTQLQQIKQKN